MFFSLSSEIYQTFMCWWCQKRSVPSVRQLPLENKYNESKTLPYSNSTKCISQFLFLELYFFQRVTLFSILCISFSLDHLRSSTYKLLCNIMSLLLIGCVSVFRTLAALFCHYLYVIVFVFGQPALWNVTVVHLREQVQKRHAPRPNICAAPWGSCHIKVPTIAWSFVFGVKKQTLSASKRFLSLFQGDPNFLTIKLKIAFCPMSVCKAQSTLGFPKLSFQSSVATQTSATLTLPLVTRFIPFTFITLSSVLRFL